MSGGRVGKGGGPVVKGRGGGGAGACREGGWLAPAAHLHTLVLLSSPALTCHGIHVRARAVAGGAVAWVACVTYAHMPAGERVRGWWGG